jgi:hypothetical protein
MRNNPPTFKERYDSEGTQIWLQGLERFFRVMVCTNAQRVMSATHMLAKEAGYWWANTSHKMEVVGTVIT